VLCFLLHHCYAIPQKLCCWLEAVIHDFLASACRAFVITPFSNLTWDANFIFLLRAVWSFWCLILSFKWFAIQAGLSCRQVGMEMSGNLCMPWSPMVSEIKLHAALCWLLSMACHTAAVQPAAMSVLLLPLLLPPVGTIGWLVATRGWWVPLLLLLLLLAMALGDQTKTIVSHLVSHHACKAIFFFWLLVFHFANLASVEHFSFSFWRCWQR